MFKIILSLILICVSGCTTSKGDISSEALLKNSESTNLSVQRQVWSEFEKKRIMDELSDWQ
jgi:hypothetical protein